MGRGVRSLLVLMAVCGAVAPAGAQFMQAAELARPGMPADDSFGRGIACDGETIFVGASGEETDVGPSAGALYVFSARDFSFLQRIVPDDATEYDTFGGRIDVDGDRAIVGASRIQGGKAYLLERVDGEWGVQQVIDPGPPASGGSFGLAVAIRGETALVSAPKESGDTGSVYVYGLVDGQWTEQQRLQASDAQTGDFFGMSLALDGDSLAVATPGNLFYPDERGLVVLFERSGDAWTQTGTVTFQGEGGPGEGGIFGRAVALAGDTLLVSARAGMEESANYGVQVFRGGGASWTLDVTLTLPDEESMGTPLVLQGERLWTRAATAGVPSVYEFVREGGAWSAGTRLASAPTQGGGDIRVCGGTLLLATSGDDAVGGVTVLRDPALDGMLAGAGDDDGGGSGDDGGCSAAGGGASATPAVLAMLVLLLARRRRSRAC